MTTAHRKRRPIVKDNRSFLGKLRQLLKKIIVGLLGFAFLSVVVIAALYYGSLRSFSQEKYSQLIVITSSVLDEKDNPFIVVYIDREHGKISLLNFAGTMKMGVLGGYGDYELRSVGPLLNLEKKPVEFIRSAYALGLEQGVDDVVMFSSGKNLTKLTAQAVLWYTLTSGDIRSTLSWWQRWQLFCYAWFLPDNKAEFKNIATAVDWQSWQQSRIQSANSACSLSVVNNTDKAKLATKVSQVLENSGVRVVRATSEGDRQPQTQILFSSSAQDCGFSLRQAENLFPFANIKPRQDDAADGKYRADVVVLVGNDLGDLIDPSATLQ